MAAPARGHRDIVADARPELCRLSGRVRDAPQNPGNHALSLGLGSITVG